MSEYKTTQFLYTTYTANGELLIYNTYTGNLLKVTKTKTTQVETIIKNNSQKLDEHIMEILINEKILIPTDADEYAFYLATHNKLIHQTALSLMVLPTHQCNCRCAYCYENFSGPIMSNTIQKNLILFAKKNLSSCSALNVSWFGGEPLLAIDVIHNLSKKLIELCKASKKPYSASMTTNGTLLTLPIFKELLKCKVISYQITIDGTRDVHDYQRPLLKGGSSYDLIIKNLMDIKSEFSTLNFSIILRINLTKLSINNIEAYLTQLENLFGDDNRFKIHFNFAANWGGERINNFANNLLTNNDKSFDILKSIIGKSKTSLNIQNLDNQDGICKFNAGCYAGFSNHYTIDSNGNIFKCAQTIRDNIKPLGNLSSDPFIWDDYEYSKWEYLASCFEIAPKCKKCFLLPTGCCQTSCVVGKYKTLYVDNQTSIEPQCPKFKNTINNYLLELVNQGEYITIE